MISVSSIIVEVENKLLYKVPMREKSNREKTFGNIRYLETDIPPEKRTLKNLPRYANKKPKVRFQDWLEIKAEKRDPAHSVTSWGWDKINRCWGWSHRAVASFKIGDKVKEGDIIYKGKEYTIETNEQAEEAAKNFAKEVS